MANEGNLKSFKKGESGNPAGKPKGTLNRATILKKFLELQHDFENPFDSKETIQGTLEDRIVMAQIFRAATGDTFAYKEIMDSMYGKIPQPASVDHTSKGESLNQGFAFFLQKVNQVTEE